MNAKRILSVLLCALTSCLSGSSVDAEDWLQFRGTDNLSAADSQTVLPDGDSIHVAWEVPTAARGISSPIVVAGHVIVTSSGGQDERDLYVEAIDATTGEQAWVQTFHALGRPFTHPTSANASPSPASDGQAIVALYSSCDLVCLGIDGSPRWFRALAVDHPRTGNDVSMSSSVAIQGGVVAVQLENQGDSFVSGIDLATGQTLWEHPRPRRSGWATPIALKLPNPSGGDPLPGFAFQNDDGVEILHTMTGELLHTIPGPGSTTSSPTWAEPWLLVPGDGITAYDLSSPGLNVAWENSRVGCKSVSPVVRNGRVYACKGSILAAADLQSGKQIWQERLKDVGSVWATPIATASGIYVIDQSGAVVVVGDSEDPDNAPEILGTGELTGPILATPAVADGAIFVRSDRSLIKLAP